MRSGGGVGGAAERRLKTDEQLCQADFAPLGKGNLGARGRESEQRGAG